MLSLASYPQKTRDIYCVYLEPASSIPNMSNYFSDNKLDFSLTLVYSLIIKSKPQDYFFLTIFYYNLFFKKMLPLDFEFYFQQNIKCEYFNTRKIM